MAHFYGSVQGSRGEASRLGGKNTGMRAEARGWHGGVRVYAEHRTTEDKDPRDAFIVYFTGGSRNTSRIADLVEIDDDGNATFYRLGKVFARFNVISGNDITE